MQWSFDDFPSSWTPVTKAAKELIRSMLASEPSKRPTADGLLTHAWVRGESASDEPLPGSDAMLQRFNEGRKVGGMGVCMARHMYMHMAQRMYTCMYTCMEHSACTRTCACYSASASGATSEPVHEPAHGADGHVGVRACARVSRSAHVHQTDESWRGLARSDPLYI